MEPRTSAWTSLKIMFVFIFRGEQAAISYSRKLEARGK